VRHHLIRIASNTNAQIPATKDSLQNRTVRFPSDRWGFHSFDSGIYQTQQVRICFGHANGIPGTSKDIAAYDQIRGKFRLQNPNVVSYEPVNGSGLQGEQAFPVITERLRARTGCELGYRVQGD
jgi:hypothetical protein